MTDTPIPYGSPCGPSYQDLQKQLEEQKEITARLGEYYQRHTNKHYDNEKQILEMCDKTVEISQKKNKIIIDLCYSTKICFESYLLASKKAKRRAYLAIGAMVLGICSTISAGYIGYNQGKQTLEQKIETTSPASSQQR